MSLRGVTSEFPLESVIGLLAGTSKTGELQVRGSGKLGALGFADGRLVAAMIEGEGGENALGAIFAIGEGDFEFAPAASPPDANLEPGDLVAILKRAAEARDRLAVMRESIPNDQLRFKLSERAADQGAVTFTPERWRALLVVNGERDVAGIAEQLRIGKMEALSLLAGLVKDGVIEILPPPTVNEPQAARPSTQAQSHNPAPRAQTWTAPEPERAVPREVSAEPMPPERSGSMGAPAEPSPPPATEMRSDLAAQLAERLGETAAAPPPEPAPPAAPPATTPPPADDRLASLTGIFAPGPAATAPAEAAPAPPAAPHHDPWASFPPPAGRAADSWTPPPPASTETPANAWAPSTTPAESGGTQTRKDRPEASAQPGDWTAPAGAPAAEADKKKGGIFGRFRKDEAASAAPAATPAPQPVRASSAATVAAGRTGLLASFSNALLLEYSSGGYGKGKIETRMANLLMRVDEQADPIDRPLPVVDDLIDATALEREGLPEDQAVPYLATLVRQVYEDAERAFGKDKAKKGYKAAQQQVFGGDADLLRATDLAGKLPKV